MRIDLPEIRRVLIIKPSAIGDVVHTLPILGLLRARFPAAQISWLVTPACAGLLDGHPMLHEVIRFDRRGFGDMWKRPDRLFQLRRFTRDLRRRRFDLVLDFQGLLRSGLLAWSTGARWRVGFQNARELGHLFYTHRVPIKTTEQHAIERYLEIARAVGCDVPDALTFPFATTPVDRSGVEAKLAGLGPFAVLLPATNWATKRWPTGHFAALVRPLHERFGLATVLAGGPDAAALAPLIPTDLNLAGQTSLRELTALLERATVVIANDSGPMHIAAALGVPLVTLFGPTNPVRTGPYGRPLNVLRLDLPCSPCYSRKCVHRSCLQWLTPEAVIDLVASQLRQQTAPPEHV